MTPYISILLGSAAIGALVSSLVTLFAQRLERQSRRKELVLSEAVKLAQSNIDTALRTAAAGGKQTAILPIIEGVIDYHRWLTNLLEHGTISDDYIRVKDRSKLSPDK